MDKKITSIIILLILLISFIVITGIARSQDKKEIRECNSKLNETDSLRNQLEKCKDDFQQDELLIEDLQGTIDRCKEGWGESIDGWDRCIVEWKNCLRNC